MVQQVNEITVSTGVVFQLTRPSLMAVQAVERQMIRERPQPPIYLNPDKGRNEPNEADPKYKTDLLQWQAALIERQYDVVIATGTKVSSVPKGMEGPDGSDWLELMEAIGIPVPAGKNGRYLAWVKYVAAPDAADLKELLGTLLRRMGVTETEVAEAVDTFRGLPERGTDNGDASVGGGADGDRVRPAATGPSAELRGMAGDDSELSPSEGMARTGT